MPKNNLIVAKKCIVQTPRSLVSWTGTISDVITLRL